MSQSNELILIDYLDGNLNAESTLQAEQLIREDKTVATEWAYLKMAVEAVELDAIRQQVTSTRQSMKAAAGMAKPEGAVVRSLYKTSLRIAAIAIVLLGVSIFYKYATVTNASVYSQSFVSYELSTTRGEQQSDALENAYRSRNWNEVLSQYDSQKEKDNKSRFLAGMADLELKKFPDAEQAFQQIIASNTKTGDSYFQEEAEYYLALSYLANNQTGQGVALIDQIKANPNHRYYPLAREISGTNLKIIELKSKK
ncbi:MAG TPA: hypothetical protein VG890_12415 [Puia sp.]|nr:hypothetical protein [Puia sp.]